MKLEEWLPGTGQDDRFTYDVTLLHCGRRRRGTAESAQRCDKPLRTRRATYRDRAVSLPQKFGEVTTDQLGGVCVYRCQLKRLCDAGLLSRVGHGRYVLGPNANIADGPPIPEWKAA